MRDEKYDLDYIQAAIETLELTALFLVRLTAKDRMNDFVFFLNTVINKSKDKILEEIFAKAYWQGVHHISTWIKNKWEEFQEFNSFYKALREKRDYFLIHINNNALSHPNITLEKSFSYESVPFPTLDEYLAQTDKKVSLVGRMLLVEDDEDDIEPSLRKVLKILRNEEQE